MMKVRVKLENCYGISKLDEILTFGKDRKGNIINGHLIYAPNGTMKTSLADTLKDIQMGVESMDYYYPNRKNVREVHEVLCDGTERELTKDDILVIDSYDERYKSDKVSTLLVNQQRKKEYDKIYTSIIDKLCSLVSKLKKESGIKDELEGIFCADFGYSKEQIFECLLDIVSTYDDFDDLSLDGIKYVKVFSKDIIKIFESDEFRLLIEEYIETYQKLLIENPVFKKEFNHTSADSIFSNLSKSGFFKANHRVVLDGTEEKLNEIEFRNKINDAKKQILSEPEIVTKFNKLDSMFTNAGTRDFRELLVSNRSLVVELSDITWLKKKMWLTYLFNHIDLLQDVTMSYKLGKQKLDEIADKALNEKTMWDEVIQQFNERFCNMPFSLGVKNQKDVMLKGELPTISFIYKSHDEEREVDEEMLLRRLSNGEKKRYIC